MEFFDEIVAFVFFLEKLEFTKIWRIGLLLPIPRRTNVHVNSCILGATSKLPTDSPNQWVTTDFLQKLLSSQEEKIVGVPHC